MRCFADDQLGSSSTGRFRESTVRPIVGVARWCARDARPMARRRTQQLSLIGQPTRITPAPLRSVGRPRSGAPLRARISHGLYLVDAMPDQLDRRCRALACVLPPDAAFSHWTAAALLGVPSRNCPSIHVVLSPRSVLPQRRELVVHGRALLPDDIDEVDGIRVTSGARLYVDLAEYLTPAELVAVGDAVLRLHRTDVDALAERVVAAARRRGVARARDCLGRLDARAQSAPESAVRYWLSSHDLPPPTPQLEICDEYGRVVAHADLGYEQWRVLVEYEGRQHGAGDQFDRDVERYSRMAAQGWLVIRFGREHLRRPQVMLQRVRLALLSRGWRPPPRV